MECFELRLETSASRLEVFMPCTMETQEILETITAATEHLQRLKDQNTRLTKAQEQVNISADKTCKDIRKTFEQIRKEVETVLDTNEEILLSEAEMMKKTCLLPLNYCKTVIECEIDKIGDCISEGERLMCGASTNCTVVELFKEKASSVGTLPAVPSMEEVPCITFQYELNDLLLDFESRIKALGSVSKMGPIQITASIEKPGAVLVEWDELEGEDRTVDVQAYRLQRAFGNVILEPHLQTNFKDFYIGTSMQYLSREMCPSQKYSFRVCCQTEGSSSWSAWSQPHVTETTLPPFRWQDSTQFYKVTNENKLVTKIAPELATHYSMTAQFGSGHSIEFTFLECGEISNTQGVGLVDQSFAEHSSLVRPGTLILATNGQVFIDGIEKLTQLPKLTNRSKVTFSCEKISMEKFRVNIECNNKTVTYDWIVYDTAPVYFAVSLKGLAWKVLVE